MQLLLARGRTRAHGQGHGKHTLEMAVACGERGVPSLRHGRHGAKGLHWVLSGFIERNDRDAIEETQKTTSTLPACRARCLATSRKRLQAILQTETGFCRKCITLHHLEEAFHKSRDFLMRIQDIVQPFY